MDLSDVAAIYLRDLTPRLERFSIITSRPNWTLRFFRDMLHLDYFKDIAALSGTLCKAKTTNNSPEMNIAEDHTIRLEECPDKAQNAGCQE